MLLSATISFGQCSSGKPAGGKRVYAAPCSAALLIALFHRLPLQILHVDERNTRYVARPTDSLKMNSGSLGCLSLELMVVLDAAGSVMNGFCGSGVPSETL
jgi:hypothetical protein